MRKSCFFFFFSVTGLVACSADHRIFAAGSLPNAVLAEPQLEGLPEQEAAPTAVALPNPIPAEPEFEGGPEQEAAPTASAMEMPETHAATEETAPPVIVTATLPPQPYFGNTPIHITLNSGEEITALAGSVKTDSITLNGGSVHGQIWLGPDADRVILKWGEILGDVHTGDGADEISVLTPEKGSHLSLNAQLQNIEAGKGNDSIIVNHAGAHLYRIAGGEGADFISLQAGSVSSVYGDGLGARENIQTDLGDVIVLNGARVEEVIHAQGGNNEIHLNAGLVGYHVMGGSGADIIRIEGAQTLGGIQSPFSILTFGGEDVITLNHPFATIGTINAGDDNDELFLLKGEADSVRGGDGDDLFVLRGNVVVPQGLIGGDGQDTLLYDGGSISQTASIEAEKQCSSDPTQHPDCAAANQNAFRGNAFRGFETLNFSPNLQLMAALPSALQAFSAAAISVPAPAQRSALLSLTQGETIAGEGKSWTRLAETSSALSASLQLRGASGLENLQTQGGYEVQLSLIQQGIDLNLNPSTHLQGFTHILEGRTENAHQQDSGLFLVKGYGAGIGLSWQQGTFQARTTALAAFYNSQIRTEQTTGRTQADSFLVSFDAGWTLPLGSLYLKPQTRALWQTIRIGNALHAAGQSASFSKNTRFEARGGLSLEGGDFAASAFIAAEDGAPASLTTGLTQTYDPDALGLELSLGARFNSLIEASVSHRKSLDGGRDNTNASVSIRRNF